MSIFSFSATHGESESFTELVRYDGQVDKLPDWQFIASEAGKKVHVPFEGYYESKGGRIQSPIITLDKSVGTEGYYSIQFTAKSKGHCYWWVDLFDSENEPLPDINSAVYPGPDKEEYHQMIYIGSRATSMQLAFVSKGAVSVSDIVVKRVDSETAAKWCDSLYGELPQIDFEPAEDSFDLLPKTASALKNGDPWRVVMLGDSIMNDSYCSVFQALVKRDYPKLNLDYTISVRGSTGCWFYEKPENFKEYVAKYNPDLLIIGGVSNLNTKNIPAAFSSIEKVIEQAKAIGCEIILLSAPHSVDWRKLGEYENVLTEQEWNEETIFPKLIHTPFRKLAKKCDIAFWNMTVPMADYIAVSGMPHGYFNRDSIHNNDRGKQIIARILQKYFRKGK